MLDRDRQRTAAFPDGLINVYKARLPDGKLITCGTSDDRFRGFDDAMTASLPLRRQHERGGVYRPQGMMKATPCHDEFSDSKVWRFTLNGPLKLGMRTSAHKALPAAGKIPTRFSDRLTADGRKLVAGSRDSGVFL